MRTVVSIPGIHCASCAALIRDVSGGFPSLKHVDVNVGTKQVTLDHDESFDRQKWIEEIEALDEQYSVHAL